METREEIIGKVKKYIVEVLEPSRPELFGFPACPFIKSERLNNKIMYDIISERKFIDLVRDFHLSDYTTAVFVQPLPPGEKMPPDEADEYQRFVNAVMKENGFGQYKNICISPEQEMNIDGFNPRGQAPYVLINIGSRKEFEMTHSKIERTKYFDNFSKDYRNYLHNGEEN